MGNFKVVTDELISWFEGHADVNTVTFGDLNEVDITTVTEFPLVHIIPLKHSRNINTTITNYQILILDKYRTSTDNKIQVLDDMAIIKDDYINDFKFQAAVNLTVSSDDVIYDQRINRLYGWSFDAAVEIPFLTQGCDR